MSFFIIIVIYEGNVGIFGFAGIASFGSVIRFLQTAVFRVWCLVPFTGFLQFIGLWVSAFLNNNCGYFGFLSAVYDLSGFAKDITHCSRAKTEIRIDHL